MKEKELAMQNGLFHNIDFVLDYNYQRTPQVIFFNLKVPF